MHIIYVDDELSALEKFELTAGRFADISSLHLFSTCGEALHWASRKPVDVAFLDIEMPDMNGIELAKKLKSMIQNIRIVFVTAHSQYAIDAWRIDASGYVLKPYTMQEIRKELDKCQYHPLPSQRIVIQTIPTFAVTVNGVALHISGAKPREMLALLVEFGGRGIITGEGIAYLWPNRANDANTQALFRMTYKRLADALDEVGLGDIIESRENRRFLHTEKVDCDLYRILDGDENAKKKYTGQYMQEYSWAEERNGQLYRMMMKDS